MPELLEGYAFTIQWFPGHMTKAKRQMESELRMVDVVVELLDARIPRASANPLLKGLIGSKVKIVALNKTDMADPLATKAWLTVIAHNKNKSLRDRHLSVIGMKGLLDIAFINGFPIDEGLAISDFNGIPANSNDTLDEITPRITGVLEDNDFPPLRLTQVVNQLIDNQTFFILQGRPHGRTGNHIGLDQKSSDSQSQDHSDDNGKQPVTGSILPGFLFFFFTHGFHLFLT